MISRVVNSDPDCIVFEKKKFETVVTVKFEQTGFRVIFHRRS